MRAFAFAIVACLALMSPFASADTPTGPSKEISSLELQLPLHEGRLNIRDVLTKLSESLGVKPAQAIAKLDWSIDVQSTLGRLQLSLFDRLTSGIVATRVQTDTIIVQVDRGKLNEQLRRGGRTVEGWIADLTGRAQKAGVESYGLTLITDQNERLPLRQVAIAPNRLVILVHGLDDPGFMWNDLIPKLREAGYSVGRFQYPNDGPISDAADLLASELAAARTAGIEHMDIVAHSMGGLVSRDVLTRPAYYNGSGDSSEKYPAIDRLVMLGTPNHGSELVRLRGIGELGEHIARALTGQPNMATETGDGSGEAGVDLLPDSDFLRRLNARPLAAHTRHTIIAGQWAPLGAGEVDALLAKTRRIAESSKSPQWLKDWASEKNEKLASSVLVGAINGLGDGCVTIESAKLQGVDDFVIVKANHVDMLKSFGMSDATPAAIPLVLDRLAKP